MYTIQRNQQRYGPYSREEVHRYLSSGNLLPTDLAWAAATQRWVPLHTLFAPAPAPAPPPIPQPVLQAPFPARVVAQPAATRNQTAFYALCAIWVGWFFLPFLNIGWGPVQLANASLWECLGAISGGPLRFISLVAIALPFLALKSRTSAARLLYIVPAIFLGGLGLLTYAAVSDLSNQFNSAAQSSPFLGGLAQIGYRAALQSATLDYGAYVLAAAALVLGWQVFARPR